MSSTSITTAKDVIQRVEARDWNHISQDLDSHGNAIMENLISSNECDALVNLYSEDNFFRSRVVMEQHGFGRGEYKYFNYPLPDIIVSLRTHIYTHLAPIANQWNKMMNIIDVSYPEKHALRPLG
ncbi:MAG: 2OG-Fe(II) oxygenase [Candidatus Nitrosopolaris sp.]